jgi:hypothetical protein
MDAIPSENPNRLLKNGASGRDPALHGVWKCSHIVEYAALSKAPCALADSLMLVFQHPANAAGQLRATLRSVPEDVRRSQ